MSRITSPIKAIRAKCLDCCCDSAFEVKNCTAEDCPLWEFRSGHNPYLKREYTEEQKEQMRERMKQVRSQTL